jgi:predicted dehydrogenase
MSDINIGVLGADRRGRISLLAHKPEEGVRITAVCGLHPDRLAFYKEKCGEDVLITSDYKEILAKPEIDVVFVCTPDHLHIEHASAALRAGKHVYLEKPMAITVEDCDTLIRISEETGKILYVGHNMRFFPVMAKMHSLIAEGRIGKVEAVWCRHFISYGGEAYFKDWHSERQYTNGLLLQKGAHDIDIIHWLAGGHTQRVVGMGKLSVYDKVTDRRQEGEMPEVTFNTANWPPLAQKGMSPKIDVEDHSMILMQLDNGVQASYQQCHYTPDDCRNYTIIGTEGRIENYGDFSTPEKWATVHLWNQRNGYNEMGHEVFRIAPLAGTHGGADPKIIADFINYVRTGKHTGATLLDARASVVTGCLASDSIRDGNAPREVPPYRG